MLRPAAPIFVAVILIILAACAAESTSKLDQGPPAASSVYFGEQPVPLQVDADLWARLVAEFDRVLTAQGTARRTSMPPTGTGSEVADLWVIPDGGGGADMRWSYRNQGDLNLDGVVSIADLTPIGVHYQHSSTSSDWIQHQIADADANGVVSITDLTPIGVNYSGRVAGYEIQMRFLAATEWTHASWVPFIASAPGSTQPPSYSFHLAAPLPNLVYRVVPTSNDAEPYQYGVASNGVLYSLAAIPFWNQQQGNQYHNGKSKVLGPVGETVAWTLELDGMASFADSSVADAYGTIYITLAPVDPGSMHPQPGTLYAVNRFGQLEWSYRSGRSLSAPMLSVDENIIVQEDGGTILCFSRDGRLRWVRSLPSAPLGAFWGPAIDENGLIIAPDGASGLNAIEPDGTLRWNEPLAAQAVALPAILLNIAFMPLDNSTIGINSLVDGSTGAPLLYSTRWPGVFDDDGDVLLIANTIDDYIGILPVGFPFPQSFLPSQGELMAPPIAISADNYVVCTVSETGSGSYNSRMYGFNADGTEQWDRGLFAGVFAPMVVDPAGNIYLSGLTEGDDAGVYCIDDGHNIVWHYSTPGLVPGAPCPAYTNLLVVHLTASGGTATTTQLTGIGVVEPEGSV